MDITAAQLRAARALLDMSQQELADKVGLHINALIRWERGLTRPHARTNQRMLAVFAELGVMPMPGEGIARSSNVWRIHTFEGIGFLRDVLDDVVKHIGFRGEHLMVSPDEEWFYRNEPKAIEKFYGLQKTLRFKERIIVPSTNRRFLSAKTIYRSLPPSQIGSISWAVYGDRVALCNLESRQSMIIVCAAYAAMQKQHFASLWAKAKAAR